MKSFFQNNLVILLTQILFLATQPEEKTREEDREMRDHIGESFNGFMPTEKFNAIYQEAISRGLLALEGEGENQGVKVTSKGARQSIRAFNAKLSDNGGVNFDSLARGNSKKPTTLAYRVSMACSAIEAAGEVEGQTIPQGLIDRFQTALNNLKLEATPQAEKPVEEVA